MAPPGRSASRPVAELFPGQGRFASQDEEVQRLKREVARLTEERDILKKATADSTGWCNSFGKYSGWSAKAERLPWARVELFRDPIEIPLRVGREICPVGEVLSEESVRVLVCAALPRTLGIAEVHGDVGGDREAMMLRHLQPAIPRE